MSENNDLSKCTKKELQKMYDDGEITAVCYHNYTGETPKGLERNPQFTICEHREQE